MIGKCCCSFICRHHQIRIIAIEPPHIRRRHDLAIDKVVGEIEQPAQIILVAGDTFLQEIFALDRRSLKNESPFRSNRHDDGVLHHLRFHQPQHLSAIILWAI